MQCDTTVFSGQDSVITIGPSHVKSLRDIVGTGHVLTEPDVMASYGIDWTGRFRGTPAAVIRPADGAEVAAVVVSLQGGWFRNRASRGQHRPGRWRRAARG